MAKLSAVIITLNEERNIGRCIDSVNGIADEIIVVDSGSTDQTLSICKEKGAKVFSHQWEGYLKQKNYANSLAEHSFILSIDADEALSDKLRGSIRNAKEVDFAGADGFEMNRLTNYCGKWIRHGGWYPDRKLRLFHRDKFSWGGERVHETMVKLADDARITRLQGDLHHYSYYNIAQHINQANNFTDLTAAIAIEKGKKAGMIKIACSPVFKFFRDYIIKLGFLDGYYGYVVCKISAQATFMKYAKIRQILNERKH